MSEASTPNQLDTPSAATSVKTRRTHTKSRDGCTECKRRKQKCDELKPSCSGCCKRGTSCVYSKEYVQVRESKRARLESSSSSSASSGPSITSTAPVISTTASKMGHFGIEDMELWHQFIKHTSETTSVSFGAKPELGLSCDYLLHGMLATAAAHLAYLHPENRQKYNLLSRQHQDLALGPFQRAMASISADNVDHLFAYGTLLVVLASAQSIHTFDSTESSGGIADWVICIRGCRTISSAVNSNIAGLPVRQCIESLVQLRCEGEPASKLSPEEESSFSRIENLLGKPPSGRDPPNNEEVTAYLHAMERLRHNFAFTAESFHATFSAAAKAWARKPLPEALSRRLYITLWPFSVSDTFVRLLSERQAPALIIMAHYCLILRKATHCWYVTDSGLRIFQAIQHTLGMEWSAYIEYPRRVFGV